MMRRLLPLLAALMAYALVALCLLSGAPAQTLTASCILVYNNSDASCAYQTPKLLAALSTTVLQVKGSAGVLGMVQCANSNASLAFIQIFDSATTASVTLGTTKPVLSLGIPPTSVGGTGPTSVGFAFQNGIQVAATTTATGSSAPSTALDCSVGYN
jgi:hypothetical protein